MKSASSEEVISMLAKAGGDVDRAGGKGSHVKIRINNVVVIVPHSKE